MSMKSLEVNAFLAIHNECDEKVTLRKNFGSLYFFAKCFQKDVQLF